MQVARRPEDVVRASIVIPAYRSELTISAALDALLPQAAAEAAEIIVVDSSPDDRTANVVGRFGAVRLERSAQRLLPHAARNRGVELTTAAAIVFTDPDCVADPGWLATLLGALDDGARLVGGSIEPSGSGIVERSIHLSKFWAWSAGGSPGPRPHLATANFAISREAWQRYGPFGGDRWSADTLLCMRAAADGAAPEFAPTASVRHVHESSLRGAVGERRARGRDFALMRAEAEALSRRQCALRALLSPLVGPLLLARSLRQARSDRRLREALPTAPLQLVGFSAWAAGEASAFASLARGAGAFADLREWRRDPLAVLDRCLESPESVVTLQIVRPTHVLRSPADIHHVLVEAAAGFPKSERVSGAHSRRISGEGAIHAPSPGEAEHRESRKLVDPMLGAGLGPNHEQTAIAATDLALGDWRVGTEVDLEAALTVITRATMLSSIFGVSVGETNEALAEGIRVRRDRFQRSIKALLPRPAAFAPGSLHTRAAMRRYDAEVDDLLARARGNGAGRRDLLARLAHTETEPTQAREHLTAIAMTAFETTALAATWTLYELLRDPAAYAAAGAEAADYSIGGSAPLVDAAIDEALRLHPPSWLFTRTASADAVLPSGARVAADDKVFISPYLIHRDPEHFDEPLRFDPARFLGGSADAPPRYTYIPFGAGRRTCSGRSFARTEARAIVARLLARADLELRSGAAVDRADVALHPADPILVIVGALR